MTDTALIGSSCALGVFWSSKRYFDYLIDETNLSLLRGKEFGQAVIICPSLREGGTAIRGNTAPFLAQVKTLIDLLHEVKAERVTYITSIDTQPETGNELSPLLRETEDEWLAALVELKNFINLRFGRVLNVYLPEVTGTGAGMSVADLLAAVPEGTEELDVALLERHQLYPMHRLVRDVEKAWECGIFSVNLVPEPVTAFELWSSASLPWSTASPSRRKRIRTGAPEHPFTPRSTTIRTPVISWTSRTSWRGSPRTNSPSPRSAPVSRPRLRPVQSGLFIPHLQKSSPAGAVLSC